MKFIEFRASVRLLTALLAVIASHAHAASFDCTKARSQVEHLVCDTPALSQLDETLAATYKVALANDPASRQRQVTWLRETRDRCNDAPCLAAAYQTQIQAMGASASIATPTPVAQPNSAPSALQLACPPDWNALTDIDGPNPERVILGLKAREWHKEHLDMVLAKTQECQRSSSAPESVKKAELMDIQTRAYPTAVAALDRRDQRVLQGSQRAQQAAQPSGIEVPAQGAPATATAQVSERELARQRRDAEFAQQTARNAEVDAQRQIESSRNDKLWIGGGILAAILAAWYWNKFIRNRCPKCKSTDLDTTDISEVDRWRGTKAVTKTVHRPGGIRGQSYKDVTKHVGVTFVKNVYSYRCRACQTEWAIEKREEK